MPRLNYGHLFYFREVAHEGNLTHAAERLAVSQSALSTQIRALEDRLGHALFDRRGRGMQLTEAGRIALDHADAVFAAGDELVGALSEAGRGQTILRVGAQSTLSRNFQMRFLRPVLGRPDVEVILRSGGATELIEALGTLSLDVVLTNAPPQGTPSLRIHPLARQEVRLVGTPERIGPPGDLAALLGRGQFLLPPQGTGVRIAFDSLVERMGQTPAIAAEVDDAAMMRLLAREGAGIALVPAVVVADELASGRLVLAPHVLGIEEAFHAVLPVRKFPNRILSEVLGIPATAAPA